MWYSNGKDTDIALWILLTTTALVAFAGAAAAEGHSANDGVSFSGDATLGYNDTINAAAGETAAGMYWDASLAIAFSKALDNGLTAGVSVDIDLVDGNLGSADLDAAGYVLSLTSETSGLYFGDTEHAAITHWSSVGGMDADNFSEVDGETVLRGDINVAGFDASLSYAYNYAANQLDAMSFGAAGAFGAATVSVAYQEAAPAGAGVTGDEVFGISVGIMLAGADLGLGYASNETTGQASTGVSVGYTVGPVALAASYVMEDAGDDNWDVSATYEAGAVSATVFTDESDDWGLEGSYAMGNGLTVYAGLVDAGEDYYVAGSYDLGGDATLLVSYVEDGDLDNGDDEIGDPEYQAGMTVEIGFTF